MSSSALIISIFEMVLILIIVGVQCYVAIITWKKIRAYQKFLPNKDNVSLKTYYLDAEEMCKLNAEDIMSTNEYTLKYRTPKQAIYMRGTKKKDGKLYFDITDTPIVDAIFKLTPTDFEHVCFEPILTDDTLKVQISKKHSEACSYTESQGSFLYIKVVSKGEATIQENGEWLITKKCELEIIVPIEDNIKV